MESSGRSCRLPPEWTGVLSYLNYDSILSLYFFFLINCFTDNQLLPIVFKWSTKQDRTATFRFDSDVLLLKLYPHISFHYFILLTTDNCYCNCQLPTFFSVEAKGIKPFSVCLQCNLASLGTCTPIFFSSSRFQKFNYQNLYNLSSVFLFFETLFVSG